MMWWIGVAFAQDLAVWDFDTTVPEIFAWSGSASVGTPLTPWSGDALRIEMFPGSTFPEVDGYVELARESDGTFVVTHDTLRLVAETDSIWWTNLQGIVSSSEAEETVYGGEQVASDWTAITVPDLGYLCGHTAGVELWAWSDWSSTGNNQVDVDDIVLTGTLCPQFADTDADGLCPQGVDLDLDGACTTEAERLPFGETADCDDTAVGPTCLTLAATSLVAGGTVTFTATGAAPGETVKFAGSSVPGVRCLPSLGGACLSIARPKLLGEAVADGAGVAVQVVSVPLTIGAPLQAQAVVVRPGQLADLSPAIDVGP